MKHAYPVFLKKSEESLNAAQSCFEQEYYNSCVNRAYYAMFQAAAAALFKSGSIYFFFESFAALREFFISDNV